MFCLEDYCFAQLLSYSISSGALESPDLLQSYSTITIVLHNTIILIITLKPLHLSDQPYPKSPFTGGPVPPVNGQYGLYFTKTKVRSKNRDGDGKLKWSIQKKLMKGNSKDRAFRLLNKALHTIEVLDDPTDLYPYPPDSSNSDSDSNSDNDDDSDSNKDSHAEKEFYKQHDETMQIKMWHYRGGIDKKETLYHYLKRRGITRSSGKFRLMFRAMFISLCWWCLISISCGVLH